MKKKVKSKKTKKTAAAQTSQPPAGADQDIVVLLSTLVEKLTSFETKLDTVLNRLPAEKGLPVPQQTAPVNTPAPMPERRRDSRPMFKVVCADCGKNTEVPFKPSGDRPVYCKECFTTRKKNGTFKAMINAKPAAPPPVVTPQPPVEVKTAPKPAPPSKKKAKKKSSKR